MKHARLLSQLPPEEEAFVGTMLSGSEALPLMYFAREKIPYIVETSRHWARQGAIIISPDDQLTQGFAILQPLEWDTKLLGIKSARLHAVWAGVERDEIAYKAPILSYTLNSIIEQSEIGLVDYKLSTRQLYVGRFLELLGFHLVDVLCTIHATIDDRPRAAEPHVRMATRDDVEPMKQLSREVYGDLDAIQDRFYMEPVIPRERANDLFGAWFENSYKKQENDRGVVFVYDEGSGPLGYLAIEKIALGIRERAWYDSLNAVSAEARGRGVYKSLLNAVFRYLQQEGQADLITKTQISNQRVINSWLHAGADIIESAATFHWTKHL